MGGGILPVTIVKGTIFFLLGRERSNNLWCDFGGSSLHRESSFHTAIREGYEELDGFLGDEDVLRKKVNNNYVNCFSTKHNRYTSYLFKMEFEEMKHFIPCFNNHQIFITKNKLIKPVDSFYEKSEIKLFSYKDLEKNLHVIRPYYRTVVQQLVENKETIYSELN